MSLKRYDTLVTSELQTEDIFNRIDTSSEVQKENCVLKCACSADAACEYESPKHDEKCVNKNVTTEVLNTDYIENLLIFT